MYENDPYRGCPICRAKLSRLPDIKEKGRTWEMYICKNDGSEVAIDPFKKLREKYQKNRKLW